MKIFHKTILACILFAITFTSCKKLIETGTPQNQLTTDKVFSDSVTTEAALVSVYAYLNVNVDPTTNRFLSIYTDEMNYSLSDLAGLEILQGRVSVANVSAFTAWRNYYQIIYRTNDIIEQLAISELPSKTRALFSNEAKFLRAYAYFYLVNIYGRVPLILTTNVNTNRSASQSETDKIYEQIIIDLTEARDGLPVTYRGAGKVRANKFAAAALLAKVYLFGGKWANADAEATTVLNSGSFATLPAPGNVFVANSQETILSIYTINGFITDGPTLIPATLTGIYSYPLTSELLNSFEANDLRKTNWVKSYTAAGITYSYPNKYRNRVANTTSPEYLILLRAAELRLIRAEALARQNNVSAALTDLNLVRQRAGLLPLPSTITQATCIDAIDKERRVELFCENSNRFLYLKSNNKLNTVMSSYKTTWTSTSQVWPIPQNEITYNNNLIQNPGY